MRELTNVFQGLCLTRRGDVNNSTDLIRMWVHEFSRVVSDRFFNISELEVYETILRDVVKKQMPSINIDDMLSKTILYTSFANSTSGSKYFIVSVHCDIMWAKR